MWAITCYFNPIRYARRLSNYREFRKRLGIPLVCVEWGGGGRFDLEDGDAEILVRVSEGSVLWQKERLLNLAWERVPPDCDKIAWIDCDVFFESDGWIDAVSRRLDACAVVQPFSTVCELRAETRIDDAGDLDAETDRGTGILKVMESGAPEARDLLSSDMRARRTHSGLAWACRRDAFEGIGFYDVCVVGSGNRAIFNASIGRPEHAASYLHMNPRWADHYLAWAERHGARVKGRVGHVDGLLHHLWHGELANRRYAERHREFSSYGFDPERDVRRVPGGGLLWSGDKPEMARFVHRYLEERREDG